VAGQPRRVGNVAGWERVKIQYLRSVLFYKIDYCIAYEEALRLLRLSDRSDRLTELVAIHIVAITKTGECDPSIIASRAMKFAGLHPAE
jgi:hypothetical protein